ncbi:GntR family transcriptional regulator [Pollutimonas sp. H1-120]|uniref:GntR family transcriptional regulator n=1 Tax=Pollutimonas sp. H1-120 TaxID=3148824 RepID=UPI003B522C80
MNDSPKKETLAERATKMIREAILNLSLEPGTRIDERILAQRFDISRTPAREALNRLASEGLIRIEPNFGTYILPLDLGEIRSFFDAYFMLEKAVAFFARLSDPTLAANLTELNEMLEVAQHNQDVDQVQRLNTRFHRRIAQATHNDHLMTFARQIEYHSARFTYFIYKTEHERGLSADAEHAKVQDDHIRIIDAIRKQDRTLLDRCMTEHARQFYDRAIRVISHCTGEGLSLR